MIRDLARLSGHHFDVLVVGGGIYGLTIAYDAAQRGLAVALIDRGDFGAATSFNHLKTLHGGLRYLQRADLARIEESVGERRTFARIAPRFVAPMAFAMPTTLSLTRNPLALRAAFSADAFLSRRRNDGVHASLQLRPGRVVSGQECRQLCEGALEATGSVAVWYDYITTRGERLTLAFAHAAVANGAVLANYVEATAALGEPSQGYIGVRARDVLTNRDFDIRATVIVSAAGPWSSAVLRLFGIQQNHLLLKAMNLVTSRPARVAALAAPTKAGRALVMLPWQGRTVIGTSESADPHEAGDQSVRAREVEAFVAEVNEAFPLFNLRVEEVTLVHRGIVPAEGHPGRLSLASHPRLTIDRSGSGTNALISVAGVKYTTARKVAQDVVDLVFTTLKRRSPACRTAEEVLPGAGLGDSDPVDPVRHAVLEEMAVTLTDVVIRRTEAGASGFPGDAVANRYATEAGQHLGWSEERKQAELEALRAYYALA